MPCKSCGKDSGKFYKGSCPECLVGRVRELEIANASLIGAIDSAIIETRRLQVIGGDLRRRLEKLECLAEAVREYRDYAWKPYNHRTFSQEAIESLETRVCDFLTALDGVTKGEDE